MATGVPRVLLNHLPPFSWNVQNVWALSAEVLERPREEFDYLLRLPFWSSAPRVGMLFDTAPLAVIREPYRYPHHALRMKEAALHYPLDFLMFQGSLRVLDGLHRLAKAHVKGHAVVALRVHDEVVASRIRAD